MVKCALTYADKQKRIVVYVRSPKDAKKIADALVKNVGEDRVAVLTGTYPSARRMSASSARCGHWSENRSKGHGTTPPPRAHRCEERAPP
jgi:hypothetical protein